MRVGIQSLLFFGSLLTCSVLFAAEDSEEILATLKQALLDEGLQQGVRMVSSGYVDSSGRLNESTYFSSNADVNGVRVLEYLPETFKKKQQLDISTLPPALHALAYGSCMQPRPVMKRNAVISISQQTRNLPALQSLIEKSVFSTFENDWKLSVDSKRSLDNRYEDAYLGRARIQNADFQFQIDLKELSDTSDMPGIKAKLNGLRKQLKTGIIRLFDANPLFEVPPVAEADPIVLELAFTLIDLVQSENNKEEKFYLLLNRDASRLVADNNFSYFEDRLVSRLERWRQKLIQEDSCLLQFSYVHAGETPNTAILNMGILNGLSIGDRFLLLGDDLIKDGLLNADWSLNMAIAQVLTLGEDRAELEILTESILYGSDFMYALSF